MTESRSTVGEFEDRFRDLVDSDCAFAFWKARVALYALLRAMRIGPGDEVIVPGYTCVMNVNPVMYLGATPKYADIDPDTFNVDPDRVRALVSDRTRVILAQHTYGIPAAIEELRSIATECGAWLVEDCCLAAGSRYKGRLVGSFGDAAYWSFQWNKMFTTGLGGMAASNAPLLSEGLREVVRDLAFPERSKAQLLALQRFVHRTLIWPKTASLARTVFRNLSDRGLVIGSSDPTEYSTTMPAGFFTAMSAGQAKAGLRGLAKLERNLTRRRRLAVFYRAELQRFGWGASPVVDHDDAALVGYPVRVKDKEHALSQAPKRFVELGSWFESPLHPKETPLGPYGYQPGLCPVAEKASTEVVMLPTHPRTSEGDAARAVRFLADVTEPVV